MAQSDLRGSSHQRTVEGVSQTKGAANTSAISVIKRAMGSIGYARALIREDYEYADCLDPSCPVRTIPLAAFAQYPPDYRNACIGVIVGDGVSGVDNVQQHRLLGAPMIFEVTPSGADRWKIMAGSEPAFLESIWLDRIESAFKSHASQWNPDSIFRAKGISFETRPQQLDFVDAGNMSFLEGIIHRKLDVLLGETIAEAAGVHRKTSSKPVNWQYLFQLVFRFVAAKVFRDRKQEGGWRSDEPREALAAIESHYSDKRFSTSRGLDQQLISRIWGSLLDSFHFQNLSVEDLAYIYENTFIQRQTRKSFGVHSTPPKIAEYLVRKLPFGDLPEGSRRVLEPCAGHGIFLVSAMRRLRELLPSGMTPAQAHNYLKRRLVAIEIDDFAREVSRLCLMLADYPNPDGWQIHEDDVFSGPRLVGELARANVVLCNPPFEDFTKQEQKRYKQAQSTHKPAELLRRVLSAPPALLGFVLPHVFTSGRGYREFHRRLAEIYGEVHIVSLPDSTFHHSDVDAVLLLGWAKDRRRSTTSVTCVSLGKNELDSFLREDRGPVPRQKVLHARREPEAALNLWIPRLPGVWAYLADYPVLGNFADMGRGIHWISDEALRAKGYSKNDLECSRPQKGFRKGHSVMKGNLHQFCLAKKPAFLSLEPQLQYDKSYTYAWGRPKVVCNAARFERQNPWRLAAAYDSVGLAFTKRFFAFWSKSDFSTKVVLSLLNSPVANAYVYAHDVGRDNKIATLKTLPVPEPSSLRKEAVEERTDGLLGVIEGEREGEALQADRARDALLRLDAAILKAYDLPPVLEREVLDLFQGKPRPVPFEFMGYYPPGFEAYLPLHQLISENFQNSLAERVLSIEPVRDKKLSAMLSLLVEGEL